MLLLTVLTPDVLMGDLLESCWFRSKSGTQGNVFIWIIHFYFIFFSVRNTVCGGSAWQKEWLSRWMPCRLLQQDQPLYFGLRELNCVFESDGSASLSLSVITIYLHLPPSSHELSVCVVLCSFLQTSTWCERQYHQTVEQWDSVPSALWFLQQPSGSTAGTPSPRAEQPVQLPAVLRAHGQISADANCLLRRLCLPAAAICIPRSHFPQPVLFQHSWLYTVFL